MSVGNTNGHSMCDFKTLTADTMKGYLIVYFLKVNCCMKLIPLKKNTMSHHRGSSHPRRFTLGSLQSFSGCSEKEWWSFFCAWSCWLMRSRQTQPPILWSTSSEGRGPSRGCLAVIFARTHSETWACTPFRQFLIHIINDAVRNSWLI